MRSYKHPRKYWLHDCGDRGRPLIVGLSGFGQTVGPAAWHRFFNFSVKSGLLDLAKAVHCNVVFPVAGWRDWAKADFEDTALVCEHAVYKTHASRRYVMALSDGCLIAHLLSMHRSLDYTAIVAHGGLWPFSPMDYIPERGPAMYLTDGADDPIPGVVNAREPAFTAYKIAKRKAEQWIIPDVKHLWPAQHNLEFYQWCEKQ